MPRFTTSHPQQLSIFDCLTPAESSSREAYQSFMEGYVQRINESTLNVQVGGVKIGSAKYSRLAQINLESRIITFSRYAIENVPDRGRRYLVIHELSHVKEPSHNKRFWSIVAKYEPNYKQVGRELELAFKRNVKEDQWSSNQNVKVRNPLSGRLEQPKLLLYPKQDDLTLLANAAAKLQSESRDQEYFDCTDEDFGAWVAHDSGIITGGFDADSEDY